MKRFVSILMAVCMIAAMIPAVLAAVPFTDVPATQWYYGDVDNAYTMGLINGKTETTFAPDDNLTYAEAVKLAACMHQRYTTGAVTLTNGEPWYQSYVDYCKAAGIIIKDYAWNSPATRAGYMEIFANALPDEALAQVNEVEDGSIPDVSENHPQAEAIYKLYRAGILQGNDAQHNCNPSASIKRSEVAAILTRMMDSEERISFTMTLDGEEEKEEEKKEEEKKEEEKEDGYEENELPFLPPVEEPEDEPPVDKVTPEDKEDTENDKIGKGENELPFLPA